MLFLATSFWKRYFACGTIEIRDERGRARDKHHDRSSGTLAVECNALCMALCITVSVMRVRLVAGWMGKHITHRWRRPVGVGGPGAWCLKSERFYTPCQPWSGWRCLPSGCCLSSSCISCSSWYRASLSQCLNGAAKAAKSGDQTELCNRM